MIEQNQLLRNKFFTESEIFRQPELWKKVWRNYKDKRKDLLNYLKNIIDDRDINIILTGAGTSAYIGDVLLGSFNKYVQNPVSAIATTDLITHPHHYFSSEKEYLLISFARSGNSPESSQVILLAENFSKNVYHLIITCNEKSELTETVSNKDHFTFLMPPEADDKGLAMTSSFTTMLLAGILISKIKLSEDVEKQINLLYEYGNKILTNYSKELKRVAALNFKRAVFLGSGMTKGIARESQLKLQELTDGKVICKYDSFMGFRHGPKAVIDKSTLVVYLFSNIAHVNLYEMDLVTSISSGRKNLFTIGVMENNISVSDINLKIVLSDNGKTIQEEYFPIVEVLPAQLLGFYKSLNLGLNPDSPSTSGMIHRVVQGVKIYPILNHQK
jgi:tagatose-6-phosphate ketose/aldose isomerase